MPKIRGQEITCTAVKAKYYAKYLIIFFCFNFFWQTMLNFKLRASNGTFYIVSCGRMLLDIQVSAAVYSIVCSTNTIYYVHSEHTHIIYRNFAAAQVCLHRQ
jgi:hypothetical protein